MNKKIGISVAGMMVLSGCMHFNLSNDEPVVLSPRQIQKFVSGRVKDPRVYGMQMYRTPAGGTGLSGAFRLHPRQAASLPMRKTDTRVDPLVPAGVSGFKNQGVLFDPASAHCWIDVTGFETLNLKLLGLNEQELPFSGVRDTDGVPAFISLRRQLMFDQLFVEELLFCTLMQKNGLGPVSRGYATEMVLGWDLIRRFSTVQFDYVSGELRLFSDQDYVPDSARLLGKADLVKQAAVCVAEGEVNGTFQDFVIDPAGDYEVAWPAYAGARIPVLTLGDMLFAHVAVSSEPVEGALPRIGGRLLERYQVTLAPSQSRIWFEKP